MLFRVARSREGGRITHYDLYKVKTTKGMTVLDALFQIQDWMDPSLAFRYSCRGAVCGSCGMLINKQPRLACRTQLTSLLTNDMRLVPFTPMRNTPVGWDPQREVLVEPLPNLPILKDLVVDMNQFFDILSTLQLWVDADTEDRPHAQSPAEKSRIERYVNCIMCAICYASCPVLELHSDYVGPAALAKAWRFYDDSRIQNRERYLRVVQSPNGIQMCELIMNCVKACPKGVAPAGAIRKMKAIVDLNRSASGGERATDK